MTNEDIKSGKGVDFTKVMVTLRNGSKEPGIIFRTTYRDRKKKTVPGKYTVLLDNGAIGPASWEYCELR